MASGTISDLLLQEVLRGNYDNARAYLAKEKITDLDLSGRVMNHENTRNIAIALLSTNITIVNISKNEINDDNAIALADAFACTKVTSVDLSNNNISKKGALGFAQKVKYNKDILITTLDLRDNNIGTRGIKKLEEQLEDYGITSVKLLPQRSEKVKAANPAFLPLLQSQIDQGERRKPSQTDKDQTSQILAKLKKKIA